MRYYFHLRNGPTTLDADGLELSDLAEVRNEAAQASLDLLKGSPRPDFWTGEPWMLWVTDEPSGAGNTVLAITLTAMMHQGDSSGDPGSSIAPL